MSSGINRQILLVEKPSGKLGPEHFKMVEAAMPEPKDGEALLRVRYISLDAANRAWMHGATQTIAALLPSIRAKMQPMPDWEDLKVFLEVARTGTLAAAALGTRCGRVVPMGIVLAAVTAAIFAVSHRFDALTFRYGVTSILVGAYFVIPYYYGLAAAQDPSGRGAAPRWPTTSTRR